MTCWVFAYARVLVERLGTTGGSGSLTIRCGCLAELYGDAEGFVIDPIDSESGRSRVTAMSVEDQESL